MPPQYKGTSSSSEPRIHGCALMRLLVHMDVSKRQRRYSRSQHLGPHISPEAADLVRAEHEQATLPHPFKWTKTLELCSPASVTETGYKYWKLGKINLGFVLFSFKREVTRECRKYFQLSDKLQHRQASIGINPSAENNLQLYSTHSKRTKADSKLPSQCQRITRKRNKGRD